VAQSDAKIRKVAREEARDSRSIRAARKVDTDFPGWYDANWGFPLLTCFQSCLGHNQGVTGLEFDISIGALAIHGGFVIEVDALS